MRADEVRMAMREFGLDDALESSSQLFFAKNTVQVEFTDDTVSFIGIAPSVDFDLVFEGQNIQRLSAFEVYKSFKSHEGDGAPEYDTNELLFPVSGLTLWDADRQYDLGGERFPFCGQIGCGDARYLAAVQMLSSGR